MDRLHARRLSAQTAKNVITFIINNFLFRLALPRLGDEASISFPLLGGSVMRKSHLALGALVLLVVGTARGSDPVGVYALVDKVILEPNGEAAQRVQVWGAFSVATGRGEAYAPPVRGYLYFTVAQGKEDVCRHEWNDFKKVAGTDQVVALGSRYEQQKLTVRRPKARPRPTARADERKVAQLVADLNSDQFTVREKASKELEKLGDSAEPALRKALAANPS